MPLVEQRARVDDLQIGAADADSLSLDEDRPVVVRRLGHIHQRDRDLLPWNDSDGPHGPHDNNETDAFRSPQHEAVGERGRCLSAASRKGSVAGALIMQPRRQTHSQTMIRSRFVIA